MTTDAPSSPHRIVVIDDHPLFRRGVQQLISMEPRFVLVGEASTGRDGVEKVKTLEPDLVLLDLNMSGMDGLQTLAAIKALGVPTRVVILTVSNSDEDLIAALRAGADGYLLKDMEPEDLLESIRRAVSGRLSLSDPMTEMLAHALRKENQTTSIEQAGLTAREQEILTLIARGQSNKQVARDLAISEGTVKVHVKHILKKLNLRSRVKAAVWMVEQEKQGG